MIWGTTIGLALAHWFAFGLSARVFGGGRLAEGDVKAVLAQVSGAASVALLTTIPTLLAGDADDVQTAVWVLGGVVGGAGYVVARVSGRSKVHSVLLGALVLVLGLTVAAVKKLPPRSLTERDPITARSTTDRRESCGVTSRVRLEWVSWAG